MGADKKQIRKYWGMIRSFRQAGYDGTTARRKAWERTFGEPKTVHLDEEAMKHESDGVVEGSWAEDPDHPGKFIRVIRSGANSGGDNQINESRKLRANETTGGVFKQFPAGFYEGDDGFNEFVKGVPTPTATGNS